MHIQSPHRFLIISPVIPTGSQTQFGGFLTCSCTVTDEGVDTADACPQSTQLEDHITCYTYRARDTVCRISHLFQYNYRCRRWHCWCMFHVRIASGSISPVQFTGTGIQFGRFLTCSSTITGVEADTVGACSMSPWLRGQFHLFNFTGMGIQFGGFLTCSSTITGVGADIAGACSMSPWLRGQFHLFNL